MGLGRATVLLAVCLSGCPRPPQPPSRHGRESDAGAAGARDALARGDAASGATPPNADPCATLTPEQRAAVVARVDDQQLTLCDFARRIHVSNPYVRARLNTPEQRRALLQSWLDTELLAAEARSRHLDDTPEVRRAVLLELARRVELDERGRVPEPTVSDEDVRAYFEAHRSEYQAEPEVRVSQVVLGTRALAEEVLRDLRAHPLDDAYFRDVVRRRTVDATTRATDGDLGFFPSTGRADVTPEVARAAFALPETGAYSDIVESAHSGPNQGPGFHILRLTARRDALHRTLEEEGRRIRNRLLRERRDRAEEAAMRALVERLRGATPVQVDEAALGRVHLNLPPPTPGVPGMPGVPLAPVAPPPTAPVRRP
ncbi:MAG: peptidyl-prolyl cis-trans isomerase [Deltaproteobacteria bacterium]|nr:peptidyl-prolyl cis-trans isomerase [Deltaproteobacteria bacterium]